MLGDLEATVLTRVFDANFLQLSSPRRSQLSRNNPPGESAGHTRRLSISDSCRWTAHKKKGPPQGGPSQIFRRRRRSDRQHPTLRVPAERGVAESGKSKGHHDPRRGLRNRVSTKGELE